MAKLNTWIFGIAKNKVIDYYRSKVNKNASNTSLIDGYVDENGRETYQIESHDLTGIEYIEAKELNSKISNAFDTLKPKYKEVAIMYFIEGRKYKDIADMLDMPIDTVKVNIFRCRAMLQNKLVGVY
jgi:RNA polymerase sigma-70 factor (ECF subfamily)